MDACGWAGDRRLALISAYRDDAQGALDSGTTTVIATVVVFCLGAANYDGYRDLAVGIGVATTVLLYFKAELRGFSQRLTAQDIRSMLRFAVLSAVILPLLPDRSLGPYEALNPFHLWLMVVLVAGVSLAGYVTWRLTLGPHGLLLSGVLGGLVSSAATTLVYARQVHAETCSVQAALLVIVLANATMLMRAVVLVGIAAPAALGKSLIVLLPALVGALPAILIRWRATAAPGADEGEYSNPADLRAAFAFAFAYALILLLAAWVSEQFGSRGVYALAAVSGLTDIDVISLSMLRLLDTGALPTVEALTAIAIAVGANLAFKTGLAGTAGGASLRLPTLLSLAGPMLGLALGVMALHALA